MDTSLYHFITRWEMDAPQGILFDLLSEPLHYPAWMKSLRIRVSLVTAGNENGIGREDHYELRAFLPYTLRWNLKCIQSQKPHGFRSSASGDMEGFGEWSFQSLGSKTLVQFEWKVKMQKPILRECSGFLRPLFEWNHDWVMRRWEKDLRLEAVRKKEIKAIST